AAHLIGPKRHGAIKDAPYESGVDPIGDARQRFNVRFYLVAMIFLLFDVEIVFFYPWAVIFPKMTNWSASSSSWVNGLLSGGYGGPYLLIEMFIFIGVLLVGYLYAWRKGVFRWD